MHAGTVRLGRVGVNRVRKFAVPEIFPPTGTAPIAHDQGRIEDPAKDAGTSQDRGAILRVCNGGHVGRKHYLQEHSESASRNRRVAPLLDRIAEMVPIIHTIRACRDARDDKFLELAVNGEASHIVTGDADLLELNPFQGIPIITPASYLGR